MKHQAVKYGNADVVAFHEEPRPELDEVMQRPDVPVCVPVHVDGPVTTHELPSRFGTVFVVTATTTPQQILGADRQRKKATLISTDNPFLISITRSINGSQTAAIWPINVPYYATHCDAITVATSTSTATISVITENWAD